MDLMGVFQQIVCIFLQNNSMSLRSRLDKIKRGGIESANGVGGVNGVNVSALLGPGFVLYLFLL